VITLKALFLLDYPKLSYVFNNKLDYGKTAPGKELKHDLTTIGLREHQSYEFSFTYPTIPEPDRVNRRGDVVKYKSPGKRVVNEKSDQVNSKIKELDPDIIIPMGTISTNFFGLGGITKAQGVPVKKDIAGKKRWILPVFSQEYIESEPNRKVNRNASLRLLGEYLAKGDKALVPERPDYFEVTSIQQAREVMAKPVETAKFGWDTETNTLKPNKKGAKIIVISFAWAEGKACAIPVGHCERYSETGTTLNGKPSYFTKEDVKEIFDMLDDLTRAKTIGDIHPKVPVTMTLPKDTRLIKVGHNIAFDEHFMLATGHAKELDFVNVVDTLTGHYLEISQDKKTSRHLSDLAFSLTSIGGYDKPLEEYKTWLVKLINKAIMYVRKANRANKDDTVLLGKDNLSNFLEGADLTYLDKYGFNTDEVKDWVFNKVLIPVVNRFYRDKVVKATMDLANISTSNVFSGGNFSYEWIPMEIMYYYAAGDADATLRVHNKLLQLIREDPLNKDGRIEDLYLNFYPKLVHALACIQNHGMQVDDAYLTKITRIYADKAEELNNDIRKLPAVKDFEEYQLGLYNEGVKEFAKPPKERDKTIFGYRAKFKDDKYKFSASRANDIATILYKNLGYALPYGKDFIKDTVWKKNKPEEQIIWSDYKTNKVALDYVNSQAKEAGDKDTEDLTKMLAKFSIVNKISSSFTDSLREYTDDTMKLHGHFSAVGTETSRLSSSQINLQNLPAEKSNTHLFNYKYPIKRMFVSRFPNGKLINLDYSSLEFHILALVTKEDSMTGAFLEGKDIHTANASLMYDVSYDDVIVEQRKAAKSIGFGLIYGKGDAALAEDLGLSLEEAQEKINTFFKSKPRVKAFIDKAHKFAENNGYVTTLNGFRRNLGGAFSTDYGKRSKAQRQSVNTIIQGSGAILTNTAVIILNELLAKSKFKSVIIATVHDSILIDCPEEEIDKVSTLALYVMEHLDYPWLFTNYKGKRIRYPIEAEVDIGKTYNDMVGLDKDKLKHFDSYNSYIDYFEKIKMLQDMEESKDISKEQYEKIIDKLPIK
jgi:DNA polymerase I-like protein with 3'-5' exonuclease and polymerase domains